MQNSTNMRILELLRFLYERTDENHPATVSDIIAHLNGKGIQAVRQTVYADTNALIDAGIDIVVVKSTQNQYFMGSRLFEYPELKMLTDAVASSKIISAKKSEELVQKLCRLTSTHQAEQLQKFAALSSRVKPHNEKVYYIIDNIQTAIGNHQQIGSNTMNGSTCSSKINAVVHCISIQKQTTALTFLRDEVSFFSLKSPNRTTLHHRH